MVHSRYCPATEEDLVWTFESQRHSAHEDVLRKGSDGRSTIQSKWILGTRRGEELVRLSASS